MKRTAAVIGLLATLFVAMWLAAAVSIEHTRASGVRYEWPMGLGTLDEVPKRYPPRVASNDAAHLAELAAAAGVDLSMPPTGERVDRPWLNRYLDAQLARVDDAVDPSPPELAEYFALHGAALAEVRAYLAGRTAIIWPTDVVAASQAPLPNLWGHLALARLLVAHALTSPETASDDLCAAWHLQRALWHRPELISKQVALAGTRMVNAAARHLDAQPAWFDEMRQIDYRRSMLAAQQSEAWVLRKELDDPSEVHDVIDMVVQPYHEVCAENLAAVMRRAAGEMAQSHNCAIDGAALERRMRAMLPFWNRPAHFHVPNLGGVWQRVARFQAEREATERVLAIKSGRWTPDLERSGCADGTWSYADGKLSFSREIAAPRPMLNVPLEYARR